MIYLSGVINMPRSARIKSENGRYHIMLRGINKQVIFAEDADREKFISIIEQSKEKSGFKLYAYCLMGNHIHLFIEEGEVPIGNITNPVICPKIIL